MTQRAQQPLLDAINRGVEQYFAECRSRVPGFVRQHFCYPGAWKTNRRAMGWDLLRAPLNLLWAPFYLISQLLAWGLHKGGARTLARLLRKIPSGLQTQVQAYLMTQTQQQLLALGEGGSPLRDAIAASIVAEQQHQQPLRAEQEQHLHSALVDALSQYALTRTATADISNTLFATIAGAFTLQKFTPGGLAIGAVLAGIIANRLAVADFILGPWLGSWYYSLFPVQPEAGLLAVSTVGVMALFAVFTCFSGLVSDPVQALLGIHQRRLNKMLTSLERDMKSQTTGSFRPKDGYLARIMDLIDAARMSLR
ncbi:DUF6635 family protein [Gilvimarinus chinensis]|uniref:DUF6635 family protein n=1 Tax=Gilvimarinus chinensis TaxID=396005 RepID=UPI000362A26B|nr:DUF6635 family protein [Gilvimarinus chinensis]